MSSPVSDNLGQVFDKMVDSAVPCYQSVIEVTQALNPDKIAATIINPPQSASVPIAKSPLSSKVEVESLLVRNQIKCPFCSYTFDGTNLSGEIACYRCYKHFPVSQVKSPLSSKVEVESLLARNQIKCPFCSYTFDDTNLSGEIACYRCYKHFSVFPRMKVPLSTSNQTPHNLSFQKDVDYTKLQNFLKVGNWREADYETYRVMLQVVGRLEGDWIRSDELLNFPCTEERTIDLLWVKYSYGRFGIWVQKRIYLEVGGIPDGNYYKQAWEKLGDRVGWRKGSILNKNWISHSEVTFDTNAPYGHLPVLSDRKRKVVFAIDARRLFSRLQACGF